MTATTQADAIRGIAPILWAIQQRLERERREAAKQKAAS